MASNPRTYESVLERLPKTPQRALLFAVERGDLAGVQAAVAAGADIRAENDKAVRRAAGNGHVEIVAWLHDRGADIRVWSDEAARRAAGNGHVGMVAWLHDRGADIRALDNEAVRCAAVNGHVAMVAWLHDHGADIRALNDEAVYRAAGNGHVGMVSWLYDHGANIRAQIDEAVCRAAGNGHVAMMAWLHDHGADIRARGCVAMFWAAEKGHVEIMAWLHNHGVDIRAWNDEAVRRAAECGRVAMVAWLHDHGADIRAKNDEAVQRAAGCGWVEMVAWLHDHGADIRAGDDVAVRQAAVNRYVGMVDWLHDHGVPLPSGMESRVGGWRAWQARHARCPAGLELLSPYLLKGAAFDDVVAMMKREGYASATGYRYAYHAAGLFGTTDRVLAYLERHGTYGKQPLHNVIQHIELPQTRFNVAAWGDAVLKHGPKMARLVKFADRLKEPLKDPRGQWSYTLTRAEVAKNAYARGGEEPALAALCFEQSWTEAQFEKALAQVGKYRARYGAGGKPGGRIPDITIDGAAFGRAGYRFSKLADGDARGLLLGEFTDCCQHLAGAGKACAKHGFLSEQGGFYVVTDPKNNIVAQSWAWRGGDEALVLDSLEQLPGHMDGGQWRSLCDQFAAAARADKTARVKVVHVGKGGATPVMDYPEAAKVVKPVDYDGYRDSGRQYRVAGG